VTKYQTETAAPLAIDARALAIGAGTFVLGGIDLTIERGTYAALEGPAGSGKSTLLDVIAGISKPIMGDLFLNGVDTEYLRPESRAIGLVPQHGYLFPHHTVRGNIMYGAKERVATEVLIDRLNIRPLLYRDVRSLSGGERQIVGLARALARQPSILLLDEPLGAVDYSRRAELRAALLEIHKEQELTTIHVSHDERDVKGMADVTYRISEGRLAER
jgi:ABC-type sulfate/molybdate transport systems ATPase subunit